MNSVERIDRRILRFLRRRSELMARIALFVIFFWFGILKVIGTSPALGLVQELFESTFLSGFDFVNFFILFGLYEMLIGTLFLFRKAERVAIALLLPHMVMTAMPLWILPEVGWQAPLTPTLEGQYIIKNLALVALAFFTAINLKPIHSKK